jgi:Uma2 family endonuclease
MGSAMEAAREKLTLQDFQEFINRDENSEHLFELIKGEIIEVIPGRTRNSEFHEIISFAVRLFCREQNLPCHTSGGAGAYNVQGHILAPDFAYKPTEMSDEYPDPVAPKWVVEIVSPTDKAEDIRNKREIYFAAGILLWEMYPKSERIDVYAPGQPIRIYTIDDVLDGGEVLPGFTLAVHELFQKTQS